MASASYLATLVARLRIQAKEKALAKPSKPNFIRLVASRAGKRRRPSCLH